MKMRKHIESWTRKTFKLGAPKSADLSKKAIEFKSEMVSTVHENSPAFFLGLRPGWILVSINGTRYDRTMIFKMRFLAKGIGYNKFEFYDPHNKKRYLLKGKQWPFGIVLSKPASKIASSFLNGGDSSWDDIHNLWRLGLVPEMAELYPVLEILAAKWANRPKPTDLPPINEPFPPAVHVDALGALALSAFAAGHVDRAEYLYRMTEARIKQAAGISSFTVSMHYYLGSLLSDLKGDHEDAVRLIRRSYKRTPNVPEVQRQLQVLTGETHVAVVSEFGQSVEMQYELPNIDPVRELPSTGKIVSFTEALNNLGANQLLLVMVMGKYRSNSYYTDDILAAAPIFKAFSGKVKHVHVICESDFTRYPEDRRDFEKLALKFKMPIEILFDEEKVVSSRMRVNGFPARYFYNKKGELLSTEKLWDETAIWEAFSKS